MDFKMKAVPPDRKKDWVAHVNGLPMEINHLTMVYQGKSVLEYGMRPEGYDSWTFREHGGGGATTLPYVRPQSGIILVGLLLERRPNLSEEPVLCAMGGMLDPGESHQDAQAREADEESGLNTGKAVQFPGPATVVDRLFWVADVDAGDGVHSYYLELPFEQLEPGNELGTFRLKEGVLPETKKRELLVFMNWQDAVRSTPCSLARSSIAQLVAELL